MQITFTSITLYCVLITLVSSCSMNQSQQNNMNQHNRKPNRLLQESSPYLQQHAYNPVNWYPWGKEALDKAKEEKKLLLVSIGYAACHWCHVMEKESFEDSVVAKKMNDNFIAVKVDREERPDVDQIYMNAVHLISGRGGWPLNAFALPDGRPVYAGTYYPKEKWLDLINFFSNMYQTKPDTLLKQAEQITKGIQQIEHVPFKSDKVQFAADDLVTIWKYWEKGIDFDKGGQQGSPKFPMPNNYDYLLRYHHFSGNELALQAVQTTLDNMADGGIYDHLGGGFARYSVDGDWHVPHFEKMLYDNAQLVSLYTQAYQLQPNERYKQVVYETLEFIERELTDKSGGFYSSLDADSEGEEGKFYVWTKEEIDTTLTQHQALFTDYYNVTDKGNWEHKKNILRRIVDAEEIASQHKTTVKELEKNIQTAKKVLFTHRSKRVRPGLDDKMLTSWNALMLKGYVDAYKAFNEPTFLEKAIKNADFLVNNALQADGRLNRNYKDGKSSINGFLDDYSLTIEAFIALYQATFEEKWLYKAKDLADYTIAHFYDEQSGMFFYTSDVDAPLIARKMELSDNVIASSNSSLAKGLYALNLYFYKAAYKEKAEQMLTNIRDNIMKQRQPRFYSNWLGLMIHFINPPYEVAIVGENADKLQADWNKHFAPNAIVLGGKTEGSLALLKNKLVPNKTKIYVCQQKVCKYPVESVKEALKLLR